MPLEQTTPRFVTCKLITAFFH